jgi:hypothetical protein
MKRKMWPIAAASLLIFGCQTIPARQTSGVSGGGDLTFDKTEDISLRDLVDFLKIQYLHFNVEAGPPTKLRFSCEVYQDGKPVPADVVVGLTVQPPDYVTVFLNRNEEGLALDFYSKTGSCSTKRIAQLARPGNASKSMGSFKLKPGVQFPLYLLAVDTVGVGPPYDVEGFREDAKQAKAALVLIVEAVPELK